MGKPAETIKETLQKLAPNAGLILERWYPGGSVRVEDEYVFVVTEKKGDLKVSRSTGIVWTAHHGGDYFGDLLDVFEVVSGIYDKKRCWQKLDAMRRRIELTDPKLLAERDRNREERKQEAVIALFAKLKKEISEWTEAAETLTPPPKHGKRALKTSRAFWEWIYPLDGPITAEHIKAAFEYWEKTGDDLYFRVESKVYSGKTNWFLKATGITSITKLRERIRESATVHPISDNVTYKVNITIPDGMTLLQYLKKRWIK